MRILLLSAAAVALMGTPALAQDNTRTGMYGSLGYSQMDGADGDLGAVTARLGTRLNRNLGFEGELSTGVKDDDISVGAINGSLKLDYDAAAYAVGYLPLSDNFELFGRAGYGTTQVKADVAGFTQTEDGESFNYGAGANWWFNDASGLRGDWTRRDFTDDGGGEVDVYSLNYVRRF